MPVRTHIRIGSEARSAIKQGILMGLRLVETTLGPRGRMVVMHTVFGDPFSVIPPKLSRDGETVLAAAEIGRPVERVGIHLLQNLAAEMRTEMGDGTTTCIVLAGHLAVETLSLIERGIAPTDIAASLEEALPILLDELHAHARPSTPELLLRIPGYAGGGTHLGEWILQALDAVGYQGNIQVAVDDQPGASPFRLELQQGVTFHWPLAGPHLNTAYGSALLALIQQPLENVQAAITLLELAHKHDKGILFIAPGYSEAVLELLTLNARQETIPITALRVPHTPDWRNVIFQDLALLSRGQVIDSVAGITANTVNLGRVEHISLEDDHVSLSFEPIPTEQLSQQIQALQGALAHNPTPLERERLEERLRFILPAATLWLSAPTQVLAANRVTIAQNALSCVRAAAKSGVVPGGGVTLWQLGHRIPDRVGLARPALEKALASPLYAILRNAGVEYASVQASLCGGASVFDVQKQGIVNPWEVGLLDPVSLLEQCIHKAISLSILLARTEVSLVQEPVESPIITYEQGVS